MTIHLQIYEETSLMEEAICLTPAEQTQLAMLGYTGRRGTEWIRGRQAARRALTAWLGEAATGYSLLAAPDGAPYVAGGCNVAVSLSHDGDYVAVALAPNRVHPIGVDLCLRAHDARLRVILDRLAITASDINRVTQWAALECVLKLRRLGVTALLGATLTIEPRDEGVVVKGLGAPAVVHTAEHAAFVVAYARDST